MHYVVADIHNNYERFTKLLKKIDFSKGDKLYILGDIFDRSDYNPQPLEVYYEILKLKDSCKVLAGNHDYLLADYILAYYNTPEKKRKKIPEYRYNTFELLSNRLPVSDMLRLAANIYNWSFEEEIEVGKHIFLLAHAMTTKPGVICDKSVYMYGDENFYKKGTEGYISVCGHYNPSGNLIWKNDIENVYLIDCGAGYKSGRLGCLRLEDFKEFYVE